MTQMAANVGMTYTIMRGTWTFAPQAQLSAHAHHLRFFQRERSIRVQSELRKRNSQRTSFSVGGYIDRTFATSVGAFRPYVRAYYFLDNGSSKDLLANFVLDNANGSSTPLSLSMAEPDRRYGTAEVGLDSAGR